MIIDARSLPPDEVLETQVCIVGAGPAGIAIALEFANQNFQVCLVESGGFDYDQETQSLLDGVVVGDPYPRLHEGRRRQFGGASHWWGAPNSHKDAGFRCIPLDSIDFEQRDWLPYSGWAINKTDLDPYYERAHRLCKIGPYTYEPEDWEDKRAVRLPFKSDRMTTRISQFGSKTPFTQEYRETIKQSKNITTLLYANVVELETDESTQTVTRLRIACLSNKQVWLKAKVVILATGGLENARLLLASNRQQPAGLGNQNDLVGRYFMDRPILSAKIIPSNRQLFDLTALYDIYTVRGVPIMGWVKLTEEAIRRERLLNNGAQLFPRPLAHQKEATQALRSLISSIRDGKSLQDVSKHLSVALKGADYIAAAGFWAAVRKLPSLQRGDWSYLPYEKRRFSEFEIFYQMEQAPDPNNRVMLSSERDRLGQPKTEVHWRLNRIDIDNARRVQEIWAQEFAKAGYGELVFSKEGEPLKFEKEAMHHHMGTTRMHVNPKQGVVDANCQVHGVPNLFVASCSVFPTAGYSNPTLTILALSIRVADRVKTLMN
ncbi:GMC oxidoreductase [Aerosakkonemataceae cyanobacterium BLCC-F50]|uniref:GMC oxidoreductase n=1 Tax=Floridaenema flaviceps BLCC-F50 TaxID=3153642 RepID=A0ABV4XSK0_9CYAN